MIIQAKFLLTFVVLLFGFGSIATMFNDEYLDNELVFNLCRGGVITSLIGIFFSLIWLVWK